MSQQLQSNNRSSRSGSHEGFTLVEVLVSIAILAIGLLSVAALVASTIQSGARARYMSTASILASEKLDSLNKWPSADVLGGTTTLMNTLPTDPNIWPGGSLTGGSNCGTGTAAAYCDQVTISEAAGTDYETQTQLVNDNPVTTTIVHTSAGCVGTPATCGVATPAGGGSTFTRRWLITGNPPISAVGGGATNAIGVRRITVLVTLNNSTLNPPVSFQMSMVRP
ncbi:MAG: type IV pilus modification PilV family protein [Candidatus Acidiferrales bacterium]